MALTVTCVDMDGKTYEVPVSELSWRPAAYGIVLRGSQILLCRHFGKYNLPGGGIELGETIEAGVVREVEEETGIQVRQPQLVGAVTEFFKPPFDGPYVQSILMYYRCEVAGGELSMEGFMEDEKGYAEMPEWVDIATIDSWLITSSYDFRPYVRQAIASRDDSLAAS